MELYFLRHAQRIDHAPSDSHAHPLAADYQSYDPPLASTAIEQVQNVAQRFVEITGAFSSEPSGDTGGPMRKNIFVHFLPYLRCCQTADLLVSELKTTLPAHFPHIKLRFQLLGDFALSEWVHDKMKNKPPFADSNEAYLMYTPNCKTLKNKLNLSNFRPTNTLGPYNGPDLSYADYQSRCKDYFQKLLATYDKPNYIKNQDVIFVVTHGYTVNNFMSYFMNHPIFDEIPEAKLNGARRVLKNDEPGQSTGDSEESDDGPFFKVSSPRLASPQDPYDPSRYTWRLFEDALELLKKEDIDPTLNLETDVVYYKTNFIKRNERDNLNMNLDVPKPVDQPRASFKIASRSLSSKNLAPIRNYNPICPAARDWLPTSSKLYQVKADFKLKAINSEAFRKDFSLLNHPSKPVSPEISPNSEPTRNNSVIDLSKLKSNEDIYKPMKLRYSTASDIPIHRLNSKVNSQVNLAGFLSHRESSSTELLSVDLPKYISSIANRKRSISNPVAFSYHSKDSYFPLLTKPNDSTASIDSGLPIDEGSEEETENHEDENVVFQPPNPLLNRAKSLNYKRAATSNESKLSSLGKYKIPEDQRFSLQFGDQTSDKMGENPSAGNREKPGEAVGGHRTAGAKPERPLSRASRDSVKFIPSLSRSPKQLMFYQFNDNSDESLSSESGSDDDDDDDSKFVWFGQNRRKD